MTVNSSIEENFMVESSVRQRFPADGGHPFW